MKKIIKFFWDNYDFSFKFYILFEEKIFDYLYKVTINKEENEKIEEINIEDILFITLKTKIKGNYIYTKIKSLYNNFDVKINDNVYYEIEAGDNFKTIYKNKINNNFLIIDEDSREIIKTKDYPYIYISDKNKFSLINEYSIKLNNLLYKNI